MIQAVIKDGLGHTALGYGQRDSGAWTTRVSPTTKKQLVVEVPSPCLGPWLCVSDF
jgi:hypothetical protein